MSDFDEDRLQELEEAIRTAQLNATYVFPDDGTDELTPDQQVELEHSAARIISEPGGVRIMSGDDVLGRFTKAELREVLRRLKS